MLKKPLFTILFLGWVAGITVLSLFSFSGLETEGMYIVIPHADKIVHFIFYFFFVVLGFQFLREHSKKGYSANKSLVVLVLAAIVYGLVMEVLQYVMPYDREPDIWDAFANALGAFTGGWLTKTYLSRIHTLN